MRVDSKEFLDLFNSEYDRIYEANDNVAGYIVALEKGDELIQKKSKLVGKFNKFRNDIISSDREVVAFVFALEKRNSNNKLTCSDIELLKKWGYVKADFPQIQEAISKTKYEYKDRKIGAAKACYLLGRIEFLSGISRSAFHWNACRQTKDGEDVYFDSSKLFE